MSWHDRLVPAQYKGVPFGVDGTTYAKSRRVSVRRFAGRDGSAQQDLGREPDQIEVQAFVWGENYDQRREDLEAVVVDEGPGILTLPTRGDLYVRVTSGPVTSERRGAGGYAEIRFTVVVEERITGRARGRTDTAAALSASASQVRSAATAEFTSAVDTRGLTGSYLDAMRTATDTALRIAGQVQTRTAELLAPVTETTRALDAVRIAAGNMLSMPSLLATTLVDAVLSAFALNDEVLGGIDAASGAPLVLATPFQRGRGARLVDAAAGAFRSFGEPFVSLGKSALTARADANARAVHALVRASALSAQADGFAKVAFDSSTFARAALERALSELDAVQAIAGDSLFASLSDLRASLTAHLLDMAGRLPEAIAHRPPAPVPAVLVAWQLYADVAMEADIIARNALSDPLRAAGTLEVLRP